MLTSKIPSGIEQVDRIWKGLFRGAAYLLYGRARYGRNLIALHTARTGLERGESCIYVSPRRPRDLAIQAESLGFDVDAAVQSRQLRLLRVPSSLTVGADEDVVEGALSSLATFVADAIPDRLIIEDFTPFVYTTDTRRLNDLLSGFIEHVCNRDSTVLFGLGEPGNSHSRATVALLRHLTTGAIHLDIDRDASDASRRILTLLPLVGSMHPRETVKIDLAALTVPTVVTADRERAVHGRPRSERRASQWSSQVPGDSGNLPAHIDFQQMAERGQQTDYAVQEPVPNNFHPALSHEAIHEMIAVGVAEIDEQEGAETSPIQFFDIEEPWDLPVSSAQSLEEDPFARATEVGSSLRFRHIPEQEEAVEEFDLAQPAASDEESAAGDEVAELPMSEAAETESDTMVEVEMSGPALELSRRDFIWSFDRSRAEWSTEGQSFLAVAIRLDSRHAAAQEVPPLLALVRAATDDEAILTASEDGQRIALLLPTGTADAAKNMLGRLREELFSSAPEAGEGVLSAIATLVLPNGDPFAVGSNFVDYVFEGE